MGKERKQADTNKKKIARRRSTEKQNTGTCTPKAGRSQKTGVPEADSSRSRKNKMSGNRVKSGRKSYGESSKQALSSVNIVKQSPNNKSDQSAEGCSRGTRESRVKKDPEVPKQKASSSVTKQSERVETGSHSPRKKRLRSFDKAAQPGSAAEDLVKPSPAKKQKGSMDNKSSDKGSCKTPKERQTKRLTNRILEKEVANSKNDVAELSDQVSQMRSVQVNALSNKKRKAADSARSSPEGLYDFSADSPKIRHTSADDNHKHAKTIKIEQVKRHKTVGKKTRLRNEVDPSLITPKTKRCKVVLRPVDQNRSVSKKIKVKAVVHTQEHGNIVSTVPSNFKEQNKHDKAIKAKDKISSNDGKGKKSKTKKIRPAQESQELPIPKMPSISFLDNEISCEPCEDDSAIFLSPKTVVTQAKKVKAQETPVVSEIIKDKRLRSIADCSFNVNNIKSTSTPNPEPKTEGDPIRDQVLGSEEPKLIQPVFSPVKQVETPTTSDYGSMVMTPSLEIDDRKREHSPSPAFSLDDDTDNINLNKSTEKSYKRSKKKFHKGRYSVSKIEEWVEKMNSEIEDIENFELSVEG